MNRAEENGSTATVIIAESPEEVHLGPSRNGKTPFVPQNEKPKPSLRERPDTVHRGRHCVGPPAVCFQRHFTPVFASTEKVSKDLPNSKRKTA